MICMNDASVIVFLDVCVCQIHILECLIDGAILYSKLQLYRGIHY